MTIWIYYYINILLPYSTPTGAGTSPSSRCSLALRAALGCDKTGPTSARAHRPARATRTAGGRAAVRLAATTRGSAGAAQLVVAHAKPSLRHTAASAPSAATTALLRHFTALHNNDPTRRDDPRQHWHNSGWLRRSRQTLAPRPSTHASSFTPHTHPHILPHPCTTHTRRAATALASAGVARVGADFCHFPTPTLGMHTHVLSVTVLSRL